MPESTRQCSLLDEIDQRQDEVLAQLDQLNSRIENLLKECLISRAEDFDAENN
ncbi:MAG: hypothetical protein NTY19_31950 [Planctomycetota bacterium]|nr:hypothetical protein [Planctomycetota bacterium]